MSEVQRFLVLGATGGTGQHFVRLALAQGHSVRAVVRTPSKLAIQHAALEVIQGSIADEHLDLDPILSGIDAVVAMLGDKQAQAKAKVNTNFVRRLVPAMRKHHCSKQAASAGRMANLCPGFFGSYDTHLLAWLAMRDNIRTMRPS
ncbi:unnamed protein product [Jaminaea pallidilutea]